MRVYKYGCLTPTQGQEDAIQQHKLRVKLWNGLTELEQKRREAVEAILAPYCTAEKVAWDAAPEAEKKAASKLYYAARKAAFALPEVKAQLDALQQQKKDAARPLYTGTGIYSWNTDDVLSMARVASTKPDAPRFRRSEWHTGMVSLRWQNGLSVADLTTPNPMLTLLPTPTEAAWREAGHSRGKPLPSLRFRVASLDRKPVFVEIPVILHRPLPPAGVIRQARLVWNRVGSKIQWHACLTVAEEPVTTRETGAVAVDLCWRRVPSGLRVGYALGTDGAAHELVLPAKFREQWDHLESIRSVRDQHFNAARDALRAWLSAAPDVPDWLRAQTSHLHQWKSPARLAALWWAWTEQRFHADDAAFTLLGKWRKRDKHLWEWEANGRQQLLAYRRHLYREWAALLASQYGELVQGAFDLRKVADKDQDAKDLPAPVRTNRFYVAPSELRSAVTQAFQREGATITTLPAKDTTVTCYYCGGKTDSDRATQIICTCVKCGREWDQDANKCRNLLAARKSLAVEAA